MLECCLCLKWFGEAPLDIAVLLQLENVGALSSEYLMDLPVIPTDVVVLGVGPGQGLIDNQACEERNQNSTYKEKYGTIAIVGKYSNFDGSSPVSGSGITTVTQEYAYNLKGQRIFPFMIAFSALSVSASAAFYSVSGLSKLFAGASFEVIVMAGSLEVAKLVIASLLYQYRKTLPKLLNF